jgi:hypothetical protein
MPQCSVNAAMLILTAEQYVSTIETIDSADDDDAF